MKRQPLTLIAIAAILTCGRNYAQNQEVETQTNEEYEHLKVLEPLVGTFLIEGKNDETGQRWEWTHTTSWIGPGRKMLKIEQRSRIADNEAALKEQEWTTGHSYHFYVWNNAEKRIEYISVWGGRGVVEIKGVHSKGNGTFSMPVVSTTMSPADKYETTVTVTSDTLVWKIHDRKTFAGDPEQDLVFEWKRVKDQ